MIIAYVFLLYYAVFMILAGVWISLIEPIRVRWLFVGSIFATIGILVGHFALNHIFGG